MFYMAWVLSLAFSFYLGYRSRDLIKKVETVQEILKSKVDKQPTQEEPKSEIIDPLDPVKEAMYEQHQMMKRLNPDE